MAFSMTPIFAETFVNATTSSVNAHGMHTLTFTLENATTTGDFLLQAVRKYAATEGLKLKEDLHNSYLSVYLVPALEVGVGALDKTTATNSDNAVYRRVPLTDLIQSQDGSALYNSFSVAGLPAGYQYKAAFELVLNKVAQPDWLATSNTITLEGTTEAPPTVTLKMEEVGSSMKVTIDTADTSSTSAFVLEVVDATKVAMPEYTYDESVIITSNFTFDAENKPVFTFSPTTEGMRKYVNYDIRIRARKVEAGKPDAASDFVVATAQPFMLPWLADFVNQTVIQGRQVEDTLVSDIAQNLLDDADVREELRKALNSGSFSSVATLMYDMTRDVAVEEFQTMAIKFSQVREQLRRIALYNEIDSTYGELLDLTDAELKEAFTFVTKQGYREDVPTSYYSWLDKAFHLGAVVEGSEIADDKFYVTVRGSVYRDRAEIVFS
ncbi:MAG: hypothetical protein GY833_12160 [Aestuariibacter sp.]|nr:hypothetical protein [Aestuariibacter sp.]|tara:strand:+ start:19482 stop:20795 length:1314 start_codon:yes stop_codon:yes gene_type:complete